MMLAFLAQIAEAYRYGDLALRIETKYCVIHTNYPEAEAAARGRFYDAFFDWFEERYYPIDQKQPLTVYLFDKREDYAWYRDHVKMESDAASFYVPSQTLAVIDGTWELGVDAHELAHHFMHVGFGWSPSPCVSEGFASFFESFAGHLDGDGRLTLSVGYFHLSRFAGTRWEPQTEPDLKALMENPKRDDPLSLSLMLFLDRKDRFRDYVLALKDAEGDPHGVKTLETVMGKPLGEIESEWKLLTRALTGDSNLVLAQPSVVFDSREDWDEWVERNRFRFTWDDGRGAWDIYCRRHERIERTAALQGWRIRQATPHVVIYSDMTIPDLAPIKTFFDRFHEWIEATGFPMQDEYLQTVFVAPPQAVEGGVSVDPSAGRAAMARGLLRAWADAAGIGEIQGEAELFAEPVETWFKEQGKAVHWKPETSAFER